MLHRISTALVKRLEEFGITSESNRDVYLFGMHQILLLLINLMSMTAIGILFHQLWQCLLYMVLFIPLRIYAGGFHACSPYRCYFYSIGCIIIAMLLVRFDCLGFLFCGILSTFCGIVIFLLAPVEDHNKPLEDVEIIHYRVRTQIVLVVEGMLLIVFESLDWRTGTVSITLAFSTMCLLLLIGKAKNILRKERFY